MAVLSSFLRTRCWCLLQGDKKERSKGRDCAPCAPSGRSYEPDDTLRCWDRTARSNDPIGGYLVSTQPGNADLRKRSTYKSWTSHSSAWDDGSTSVHVVCRYIYCRKCQQHNKDRTTWPSGLRRYVQVVFRKGVSSNLTVVTTYLLPFALLGILPFFWAIMTAISIIRGVPLHASVQACHMIPLSHKVSPP